MPLNTNQPTIQPTFIIVVKFAYIFNMLIVTTYETEFLIINLNILSILKKLVNETRYTTQKVQQKKKKKQKKNEKRTWIREKSQRLSL